VNDEYDGVGEVLFIGEDDSYMSFLPKARGGNVRCIKN
jgi:hypothetical protein